MPVPLRRFSQNWLANDELALALARDIAPLPGDRFLEIGPGEGRLTRALLRHPVSVIAVEIDPRCCEGLRELAAASEGNASLEVIEGDILQIEPEELGAAPLRFVGNLPYALASPILRWTAGRHGLVTDVHYMLPADLAERLLAPPGSSSRGLLSVLIAWFFDATVLRRLGPGAFRPPPKIDSAFLRLLPHEPQPCAAPPAHRRADIEAALAAAGVPATARAEELEVAQFAHLAEQLPERPK